MGPTTELPHTPRKRAIHELAQRNASGRDAWIRRNAYFHEEELHTLRFLVPTGLRVIDLGCGTGHLLAGLEPSRGVGVDFSEAMVTEAKRHHPQLEFIVGDAEDPGTIADVGGPFDVVLLVDTMGLLEDCQGFLESVRSLCGPDTRLVIVDYSRGWEPVLKVAERAGLRMPQVEQNWLSTRDMENLLELAGYDVVSRDRRQILPRRIDGLTHAINRYVGTLPGVRRLALRTYLVARVRPDSPRDASATVVIPCRNEAGNIAPAVERIPHFCDDLEIIFVEGHSCDETVSEIERVIAANPGRDIKAFTQDGVGKADAVRKGFTEARGEILMILDADLTTPPEDLPKFYEGVVTGQGELVMGTRLVYPMEEDAMRLLNRWGNRAFSWLFTWLLDQRITDTLCGTKVLRRHHWRQIEQRRGYFGDFDPFGDFDLIFGAAKLNLRILEIPVRYRARVHGTTQISRFRHGLLLARMVAVAYRKLKVF